MLYGTSLLLGNYLLSGCDLVGELLGVVDNKKTLDNLADEYDNVLNRARGHHPIQKEEIPKQHSRTKQKNLEWYFFRRKELKGLELAKSHHEEFKGKPNPYIASSKDIGYMWKHDRESEDIIGIGGASYLIKPKNKKEESQKISQMILQFQDERKMWKFLWNMGKSFDFSFLKDKTISNIILHRKCPKNTDKIYQELTLLNCLVNYQKRLKGDVLYKGPENTNSFTKELGISDFSKYFVDALEYQKKFYRMNNEELYLYYKKRREKFEKEKTSKEDFLKRDGKYFIPFLPELREKMELIWWSQD
jgi:hypothetical protein